MIARRIITVLLFLLFLLVLELNQNSFLGWILVLLLTVLFFVLWEKGVFRKHWTLKILSWILYFGAFAAILFLTWPPMKRVPAVSTKDPVRTAVFSHAIISRVSGKYKRFFMIPVPGRNRLMPGPRTTACGN